jgi:hypothetical protein
MALDRNRMGGGVGGWGGELAICGYIDRKGGLTPGNICTVTGLIPPSHSLLAMYEFAANKDFFFHLATLVSMYKKKNVCYGKNGGNIYIFFCKYKLS